MDDAMKAQALALAKKIVEHPAYDDVDDFAIYHETLGMIEAPYVNRLAALAVAQAEELAELRAIVEPLPITADGKRHNGIAALWGWIKRWDGSPGPVHAVHYGTARRDKVAQCYSTCEAAEAARLVEAGNRESDG